MNCPKCGSTNTVIQSMGGNTLFLECLACKESIVCNAAVHQPEPRPGDKVVVHYVLHDIQMRAEAGLKKYGTYLETKNGRDALWDAYQEAIDLVMYLRQAILEREE